MVITIEKRIIIGIIVLFTLFPISIFLFSEKEELKIEDKNKAEQFFSQFEQEIIPITKQDGTPFHIAYVDIDPYPASGEMLYYWIEQLIKNGWIETKKPLPFIPEKTDAKELIYYLSEQDIGPYIQFSKEACYYLEIDGEEPCRKKLQYLIDTKAIDLIFCMGTTPGLFVKSLNNETIPVLVYFSVDPVGAGISKGEMFSGTKNIWCHVNYSVYNKQMQFYYDNYPFTNIGMIYYSESVAAIRAYEETAEKNRFLITKKKIKTLEGNSKEKKKEYYLMLETIFQELIEDGIDAFMLNTDIIKEEEKIKELIDVFYEHQIPVFVQNGEYYVQNGAFMIVTASDAKEQAPFIADTFANILYGREPGKLNQEFITPPYLSINLEAADRLHYKVKEELILSAEKLYTE